MWSETGEELACRTRRAALIGALIGGGKKTRIYIPRYFTM